MAASGILVEAAPRPPLAQRRLEMCEHKGVGHPDSLTDGACEAAAVALSRAYRRAFGVPMHFNVDKGLLVAGCSAPRFGGGEVLQGPRLIICGRAADTAGRFDAIEEVMHAARRYLAGTLRRGAEHFRIECEIRRGSRDLEAVYAAGSPAANDTSFGVGFWPYSALERLVLDAAALMRSEELRRSFPAAGDDFKIMGVRRDHDTALTLALALVDREVRSAADYFQAKLAIAGYLSARLQGVSAVINTLDNPAASGESGLYLTVTGLSAEMGDDGQVGRGNRVNGLITPGRAMSLEAAAGKNPARHVGKIYNLLAIDIARAVCEQVDGVLEASVQLVSQIGRPVDAPWAASVEVLTRQPLDRAVRTRIESVAAGCLETTGALSLRLENEGVSFA